MQTQLFDVFELDHGLVGAAVGYAWAASEEEAIERVVGVFADPLDYVAVEAAA